MFKRMEQKIDDLTVEQIGQIFPIEIVSYNKEWETLFITEKELIINALNNLFQVNIEHIGSTSVQGLSAKPIIDILIEFPILTCETKITILSKMSEIGYENMSNAEQEKRMTLGKGYDLQDTEKQKFHAHIREKSTDFQDEIYFRNHLRENSDAKKKYEALKNDLGNKHKNNREDYTNAKTNFITAVTETAKNQKNE